MKEALRFIRAGVMGVALFVAISPGSLSAQDDELAELIEIHRAMTVAKRLQNDTIPLSSIALENYVVIPPGGLVETRAEAMAGVRNFDSDNLEVQVDVVAHHDSTAVLVGTVVADGQIRGVAPQFAKVRFMAVYVRSGGAWRLLAQSNTPCHPRAIEAGRC